MLRGNHEQPLRCRGCGIRAAEHNRATRSLRAIGRSTVATRHSQQLRCSSRPRQAGIACGDHRSFTMPHTGGVWEATMRKTVTAVSSLAALLAAAVPVLTVTNGQPDGNNHPYVGIADSSQSRACRASSAFCSGSALSSTVFLTAAHCFDPLPGRSSSSFKSGPPFSLAADFTPGTFHPHPDWCFECGPGLAGVDFHDVAVVELDAPVTLEDVCTAAIGFAVDTLPMKTADRPRRVRGTGLHPRRGQAHRSVPVHARYFAPSELVQSNNVQSGEFIKLTANPAQGKGGICFGDSGGPDLLSGTPSSWR